MFPRSGSTLRATGATSQPGAYGQGGPGKSSTMKGASKKPATKSTKTTGAAKPASAPAPTPLAADNPAVADERMDGVRQAATLQAAAKEGIPFCAECEKRKKHAAGTSAS